MAFYNRNTAAGLKNVYAEPKLTTADGIETTPGSHNGLLLPTSNHNGGKVTKGIHPDGESGRSGFHPLLFLKICFCGANRLSMAVNILWPFVPAVIALVSYGPYKLIQDSFLIN